MTELPLIVCDIQRAGPSTGMPTKTEQADLLQVMFGRNGEAPVPVLAAQSPADCFDTAIEAVRIAIKYRTPVIMLVRRLHRQRRRAVAGARHQRDPADRSGVRHRGQRDRQGRQAGLPALPARSGDPGPTVGHPGHRRPAAPDRRHREGQGHRRGLLRPGQPRGDGADPRRPRSPASSATSPTWWSTTRPAPTAPHARVLVLGWGSTYGPIVAAVRRVRKTGRQVAYTHLRHLNPFPANLGAILRSYDRVIVPEMNLGQLALLLRARVSGRRAELLPGPRTADLAQRAGPRSRDRDRPTGRSDGVTAVDDRPSTASVEQPRQAATAASPACRWRWSR